ncbi:MAG: isoprenyl transferase [Candidatus Omnitrophota bacterium]
MLDPKNMPRHVAIIMDGNGRWAQERGLSRTSGHRKGIERVKEIVKAASELQIKTLTLFAFSAENWQRPKKEVGMLMRYLDNFLGREIKELDKNNICFRVIGRDEPIPKYLQDKIRKAEEQTKDNSGMTAVFALNYGSRQEIVDAVKRFASSVIRGEAKIETLNESGFSDYLDTKGFPEPDLLIRTSGEMRLSNFLLWQLSYAELYFTKKYWPDFSKSDLEEAIEEFQKRQRRFGKTDVDKENN